MSHVTHVEEEKTDNKPAFVRSTDIRYRVTLLFVPYFSSSDWNPGTGVCLLGLGVIAESMFRSL
jgi:hypothetical protein